MIQKYAFLGTYIQCLVALIKYVGKMSDTIINADYHKPGITIPRSVAKLAIHYVIPRNVS